MIGRRDFIGAALGATGSVILLPRLTRTDLRARIKELEAEIVLLEARLGAVTVERDVLLAQMAGLEAQLAECENPSPIPLVAGLMVRDGDPAAVPYPPNLALYWDALQPTPFGPLDTAALDTALASGKPFRVRLMCGVYAPAWLRDLVGTFAYVEPQAGKSYVMPRTWDFIYVAAYRDLIRRLGVYEGLLSAVFCVGAMFVYAEPCIRGIAEASNRAAMLAAGYTLEADLGSQRAAIDAHADAFSRTRTAMSFNAYQHVLPDGSAKTDIAITADLIAYLRERCGPGAIVQNNSLRSSYLVDVQGANGGVYGAMLAAGPPLSFQTATASRVGDLVAVLDGAASVGAHAVELPGGHGLTAEQLAVADAALRANGS